MRIFIFCLYLLFLLPMSAPAADNVLRVSFNELPPWKILDKNGTPTGIDIELLHRIARQMNLEIEYVFLPFKRGLKMVEHGQVDLMLGVLRRSEREVYAHFLSPPYKDQTHKAFYVRKGNEDAIKAYEDLADLIIGTQLGEKYFPRFDNDSVIKKYEVKNMDISMKMLIAGRIDAFITTEATGDYRLEQLDLGDEISKARFVYSKKQDVYMILSKRSPHLGRLDEFNEAMKGLVEQGEFDRIKNEFFLENKHKPGK